MNSIIIFEFCAQAVQVRLEGETVWLTQTQMAELFGTTTDNISLHLKNVYASNELEEITTTEDFSVVRQEGARTVKRQLKHYNLDAIISVGYRVNSTDANRFRQWATNVLRQHLVDGYSLSQRQAAETLASMGLTVSDAVRVFLTRVVADKEPPFMGKAPNAGSRAAMAQTDEIINSRRARFTNTVALSR
jgi:addiction module RelB/DinJ family antitoxin